MRKRSKRESTCTSNAGMMPQADGFKCSAGIKALTGIPLPLSEVCCGRKQALFAPLDFVRNQPGADWKLELPALSSYSLREIDVKQSEALREQPKYKLANLETGDVLFCRNPHSKESIAIRSA